MSSFSRFKNQNIAKLITRLPFLAERFNGTFPSLEAERVPWTPLRKPLAASKVAIVTTAGVHHRHQPPFDMNDPDGDPTFRVIDIRRPISDLVITHDYYDHSDAERDINIIFPIERFWELEKDGFIGKLAETHYGLMGHVIGRHIQTLIKRCAPEVAKRLKTDDVDVVLLTPG